MSILEIDLGNTRLKWRLASEAGETLTPMAALDVEKSNDDQLHAAVASMRAVIGELELGNPRRARIGSVRDAASNLALEKVIAQFFGASCEFARSGAEFSGVKNHYRDPAQMGVDRWLAIVGAALGIAKGRACCVVDAGSAMTIECIREDATHLGGFILPGYKMQVHALLRGTDKVAAADALHLDSRPVTEMPDNTVAAVGHGVLLSLTAAVDQAIQLTRARSDNPDDHLLIFTGGDAQMLASYWQSGRDGQQPVDVAMDVSMHSTTAKDVTMTESLVLDGLRYLLP